MSTRIFFFLFLTLLCTGTAKSQDSIVEVAQIRDAISQGDVNALMKLSARSVELALYSASRQYTTSQAGLVLKRFFRENPPVAFEIVKSSGSANGVFIEARMRTSNISTPLRTYLRLNKASDGWKLRELLIESPDR